MAHGGLVHSIILIICSSFSLEASAFYLLNSYWSGLRTLARRLLAIDQSLGYYKYTIKELTRVHMWYNRYNVRSGHIAEEHDRQQDKLGRLQDEHTGYRTSIQATVYRLQDKLDSLQDKQDKLQDKHDRLQDKHDRLQDKQDWLEDERNSTQDEQDSLQD